MTRHGHQFVRSATCFSETTHAAFLQAVQPTSARQAGLRGPSREVVTEPVLRPRLAGRGDDKGQVAFWHGVTCRLQLSGKRGVRYEAADSPGMTKLVVHILAAVAEDERKRIADRTRDGLKAAKAKGIQLGNPKWQDSVEAAREARSAKAAKRQQLVRPLIEGLQAHGIDTLSGLADALNERGIETPQGRRWHPMTVKRVIEARA